MSVLRINDLKRHHSQMAGELAEAVADVMTSGWYVLGDKVSEFEHAFARFCGTLEAVGVANGTDALELALLAVGVALGDEVATVANAGGYATCSIFNVGAVPLFVDVDATGMTMDAAQLAATLTPRCRAIVVTHLYGRIADMDDISAIGAARGIPVVEDCAQAHGATWSGRRAGSLGTVGCFSFYPTKNLGACGDAGAVVTSDPTIATRLRRLRQYGWSEKYSSTETHGRNSRLDEIQAAILARKLPRLDEWNQRRLEIAERYGQGIRHPDIELPRMESGRHVAHLYVVRTARRDSLREHLREREIAAEVHYPIPDHRQPAFRSQFARVRLPVTEKLAQEVLTLPCFPELTDDEVDRVIAACQSFRP